jgi:hypothetical protein
MKASNWFFALAFTGLLFSAAGFAPLAVAQELTTPQRLSRAVELYNVSTQPNGVISGKLANRTGYVIRDVKLMIDYAWIWRNDFKPGADNPGRTLYTTVRGDIGPHGENNFTFEPSPPLSSSDDGHFDPVVKVVGYTQIVPQ